MIVPFQAESLTFLRVRGVWADFMASSSVAMYSRNICTMQRRLVVIPAASADWLRRASCASIFRASIRADERLALSSCKGVFKWITFFRLLEDNYRVGWRRPQKGGFTAARTEIDSIQFLSVPVGAER
jgi:hypothetical protein